MEKSIWRDGIDDRGEEKGDVGGFLSDVYRLEERRVNGPKWVVDGSKKGVVGTVFSSPKSLVADLRRLYREGTGWDVRIFVGGKGAERGEIHAHRLILAARCRGLRALVEEEEEEKRRNRKKLGQERIWEWSWDVSKKIAQSVVEFCYTGEINLSDATVFEVTQFADKIGADAVVRMCKKHILSHMRPGQCIWYLIQAADYPELGVPAEVMEYLRRNTHSIINSKIFASIPPQLLETILQEDELSCSEDNLWQALVRWGIYRAQLHGNTLEDLNSADVGKVLESIYRYLRPGLIRVFNLTPRLFSTQIEAFGLLSKKEVLEKYRYDTILSYATTDELYRPREEILKRLRRRVFVVESLHPHPIGSNPHLMKQSVELPNWCQELTITFDRNSFLGRYSDLNFYIDADCTTRVFSFHYASIEREKMKMVDTPLVLEIPSNRFWFTFYSPANFPPEWGYRFECVASKTDFDREEDNLDRLAQASHLTR